MDFDMSAIITLPALGRSFKTGMLYDCRNDTTIPDVELDMKTIHSNFPAIHQETEFKIIASDSIEEKASVFDLPDSLKTSFLCGLIDVSGAAKYLKEKKASKKQARVALVYTTVTCIEQLTTESLQPHNIANTEIFDQDIGTHVVTGVSYGVQALYVFEHGVASNESKYEIHKELQKELKMAISKEPMRNLWHRCNFADYIATNKLDQHKLNNASCTFYGDYALTGKHSNTTGETSIPLKVWLYPLWKLNSMTTPVVHSISPVLVEAIQVAMEELSDIDMQCEDLLNEPAAMHFADIKNKIQRFRKLLQRYKWSFQKALGEVLLLIRRGSREKADMVAILTAREQSPFNNRQLTQYIESVEKEVGFVSFCLSWMKGSQAVILDNYHDLWDPRVQLVVFFMFTSLQEEEPYLLDLKHWLQQKPLPPTSPSLDPLKKSLNWLDVPSINKNTRTYVNEFIEFASSNKLNEKIQFIVSAIADPGNRGASIYLYEKGGLKSSAFCPPCLAAPAIASVSHDRVQLTCAPCPAGSGQLLGYSVEYRSIREDNWTIVDRMDINQVFTVTGLLPNSLYQFRQSAVLTQWVTRPSNPTAMIKTLPCSRPRKMIILDQQPTSITLRWEEPVTIGAGAQVTDYMIEFSEEPNHNYNRAWWEMKTGKKTEVFTFQQLKPNSSYRFRVSAVCKNAGISAPSKESVFSTTAKEISPTESKGNSNFTVYDFCPLLDRLHFH